MPYINGPILGANALWLLPLYSARLFIGLHINSLIDENVSESTNSASREAYTDNLFYFSKVSFNTIH